MPISTKPSNAVKADAGKITKTLRWLAREAEFVFAAEQLNEAAALIESMQAQLAEREREIEWLNDQLTARLSGLDTDVMKMVQGVPIGYIQKMAAAYRATAAPEEGKGK